MKKTIFLLAIVFATIAVAFIPSNSIPVKIESISEDEEIIALENQALDITYQTMLDAGGPFDNPFEEGIGIEPKKSPRYCITTAYFYTRSDRLNWVVDEAMGGWGNPNHVHYISFKFSRECAGSCPSACPCWSVSVAVPC